MSYANHKLNKATGGKLAGESLVSLIEAGYTTPGKIKDATDEQLQAVSGIGQDELTAIREVLPKR